RTEQILHALDGLEPLALDALLVLALEAEHGWSRTHWQEHVADAGIVDDRGRKVAGETFKAIVGRLHAIGAVTRDARGDNHLCPQWLAAVIENGRRRGRVEKIALELRMGSRHRTFGIGHFGSQGLSVRGELLVALVRG